MPHLEGPTTKIYNYVLGGFGEKKAGKEKDWQQLLGTNLKNKLQIRSLKDIKRIKKQKQAID